jgi:hypothetical protein
VKESVLLTIALLVSILLMTLHLADDIVRGLSPPGADNIIAVVILFVWLYGTLVLGERLSGYIIMLLGSIFAAAMPVVHMTGASYPKIAESSGGLFFVWTLLALGAAGLLSFALCVRGLWRLRRGRTGTSEE